jgi:hypothetical protein
VSWQAKVDLIALNACMAGGRYVHEELAAARAEIERLKFALKEIAKGDGIYGAQAREYKDIARAALEWKEP